MEKIAATAKAQIDFAIRFNLTVTEAKALEALVCYGIDSFLEVFYAKMGKAYLQPHEKGLISLFEKIKNDLSSEVEKIETAKQGINNALKQLE